MESAPVPAVSDTVDNVRRLIRGLRVAEQRTRLRSGLSAAQLFVLQQLSLSQATSLSDLADRTMTDRSSVTAVVERLAASGLATTARDPQDRRRVVVEITEEGRRRLEDAPEAPTTLLIAALSRLPTGELEEVRRALQRLVESMGLSDEPPTMLFEEGTGRA